jgi:hypothetical protein
LPRNDEISVRNAQAGATLAKMQAEATLCQNLFTGFLLLLVLNDTGLVLVPLVNTLCPAVRWLLLAILGLSAIFRIAAYCGRQNNLYEIIVSHRALPRA